MTICYFTATGNSFYAARRIGGQLLSIPRLMKTGRLTVSDDAVGIVCPVYAGEMPAMVRSFLSRAAITAGYFFFVYTYGMSSSVAVPNAIDAARKAGRKLDYAAAVKMVDNYLPGFEAKHQMETAGGKNIEGQIDQICRDLASRKNNVSGLSVFQKLAMTAVHGTMGRALLNGNAARSYRVNDACVRCGICAKVCPADNIRVTDRVEFSDHCEVCYACIHNCPQNAIHLKSEKSTVRFRNEHVTLQDILASNE